MLWNAEIHQTGSAVFYRQLVIGKHQSAGPMQGQDTLKQQTFARHQKDEQVPLKAMNVLTDNFLQFNRSAIN